MNTFIVVLFLIFLIWIYYKNQAKIGKYQAEDWKEFVEKNPQYFRKPIEPKKYKLTPENEKYIHEMWARYKASHTHKEIEHGEEHHG